MRDNKSQYPDKINVWIGMIGDHLIGSFFIDGNLNSEMYETMLIEQIIPAIRNLFPNDFDRVWFQQDGTPAHFGLRIRMLLDELSRIDGLGGVEQLSSFQDPLICLNFFYGNF